VPPVNPVALASAVALHRQGDFAAAEARYIALWQDSGDPELLHLLGVLLRQQGDLARAAELIGTALEHHPPPGPAIWWYNFGNCLKDLGDSDTARHAFAVAADLHPDHPDIALAIIDADLQAGDHEGCRNRLEAALSHHPGHADLLHLRARLALAQDNPSAALVECQAGLPENPDHAGLHHLAGQALFLLDRPTEAIQHLRRALNLDAGLAEAWNDLGMCQRGTDESITAFRHALALKPDWPLADFNLAHALLLAGDYGEGFQRYEARWRRGTLVPRPFVAPLWQGEALPPDATLLLHAEQGIGDTIQMLRFVAPAARRAGCQIILELPPALIALAAANLPPAIALHPRQDEAGRHLPAFNRHLPLMSLPDRLGISRADLSGIPYLRAPSPQPPRQRLGLVWAGNPDFPLDRLRSIRLADLAPLWDLPGIELVSLQKGKAAEDLADAPGPILDGVADCRDFADTANVMTGLAGVISVDTGPAHLAAALGCPTWILLPAHPEWRWGRTGERTAWYDSAHLIRRPPDGVAGQVRAVCAALERHRGGGTGTP